MGEISVYYVPENEAWWIGREREAAEAFWHQGIFVATPDRWAYNEIARYQREGLELPGGEFRFSFAEMGLGGLGQWESVPNLVYEQRCPSCSGDISAEMHERWEEESAIPLPERSLDCPHCGTRMAAGGAVSPQPFVFSRFYLWIADIDPDDWDPKFKGAVESVLGPCAEFTAWET